MNIYAELFLTFAKIGATTFGGGYAMLPILQREVVERKCWATEEQMADYYAIGQCTPGIIAVDTAAFIGHKLRGDLGAVVAVLGMCAFPFVITSLIASVLREISHIEWLAHAFAGMRAGVVALILSSVIKLVRVSVVDVPTAVLFGAVLLLAAFAGISPVLLVVCAGLCGLGIRRLRGWKA